MAGDASQLAQPQPTVTVTERVTEVRTVASPTAAPTEAAGEPGTERVVASFGGAGARTTQPFEVEDGWEVRWDYSPGGSAAEVGMEDLTIALYAGGGTWEGIVASQQQAGAGSAYQPKGGSYYLDIRAFGSWTVTVVQLP